MKRPALPDDGQVLAAAMLVSRAVWHQRYEPGEGPLHYAGGPAQRRKLLADAKALERQVAAMRLVAEYLPDGEDFFDVPARRQSAASSRGFHPDRVETR